MQRYTFQVPDPARLFPEGERGNRKTPGPLIPFEPSPLDKQLVLDRDIEQWTANAGSYGMGGSAFLGFKIEHQWLLVAIWDASSWFRFDGRMIKDRFWEKQGRPRPWIGDKAPASGEPFKGHRFVTFEVLRDSVSATLEDGRRLALLPDSSDRPLHEGNGEPRTIEASDDLRPLVFLSPTDEIFI